MKEKGKYKSGFKTPEEYFEGLDDKLMGSLKEDELPKQSGFEVPVDYFEQLEENVMASIASSAKVKVIPLYKRKSFVYVSSIAACLALLFTLYTKNIDNTPTLSEVADAEIEAYLEESGLEYNSYDIAQMLTEDDLSGLPAAKSLFSEESLEDYLLENIDDTTLLIE